MGFIKKKNENATTRPKFSFTLGKNVFFFNYVYVRGFYPHKTNFLGKK